MNQTSEERLLASVEKLFYGRGIGAVSIRDIRDDAELSLKYIYGHYNSKMALAEKYLERRNEQWIAALDKSVSENGGTTKENVEAIFDWLASWASQKDFNGCAFANASIETGTLSSKARKVIEKHFVDLRKIVTRSLSHGKTNENLVDQVMILIEGAIVLARIRKTSSVMSVAKNAALRLVG